MTTSFVSESLSLIRTDAFLELSNPKEGFALRLNGNEEFRLEIGKEATTTLSSASFHLDECRREEGSFSLFFSLEGLRVEVIYQKEGGIVRKTVRFHSDAPVFLKRVYLETRISDHPLSLGGEGLPIFASGIAWLGIEFPAANNRYEGNAILCKEAPFLETTDYQCLPFVYGVAQEEGLEAAFRAYIDETAYAKRDEFLSVYCNWGSYDNMTPGDPVFSSETLAKNFRDLDSFYEKSGSRPEYFLQDAFWFAEGSHYLAYDDSKLKEGPKFILDNIAKRQMKYGLWFDINFREDKRKDWTEMDNGLGVGALCLNEEKVYRAMEKAILARVKEDGIKMLKFDFAYFECHNPNHEDHSHDHVESKQKAILHFIQMVGDIRALDPEIKILCYNGWTKTLDSLATSKKPSQPIISPYWTRYVDRLYCGDPRPSEIPTPSFSDSVIYYTDSMVRNFYDSFIPLRCIDDHGSMCGNTGTIYYLGDAIFRKSILMNVARGGQKLNPYGDLGVLDQEDFDAYRKAVEMMKDMQKKNLQSVPILGDPRLEEVYGYFSSNGEEGYLTILNPSCGSRIADIDLPAWRNSDIELSPFYGTERSLSGYSAYRLLVPANSLQIYSWKRIGRSNQKYAENGVKSLLPERKMVLAPGQRAIIHAKSGALSCRFFLDEKPYRSGTGYPEGIRVLDEEEIPLSDSRPCSFIWSGLSWLWFPISEPKRVEIRNDGEKTYTIQIGQHPTI